MARLKTCLLLSLAALLLVDAADCFATAQRRDQDMECCQSMPCSPANQSHDCCKKMVVERDPYVLPAASSVAPVFVAVSRAPVLVMLPPAMAQALSVEARDHAPPLSPGSYSLPLLI